MYILYALFNISDVYKYYIREFIKIKKDCLLFLQIILYGNESNQSLFLTIQSGLIYMNNNESQRIEISSLVGLLRLTLCGYGLNKYNIVISDSTFVQLSSNVIYALLYKNRKLQIMLMNKFLTSKLLYNINENNTYNHLDEFGSIMLQCVTINHNSNNKQSFGNALKYWNAIRIISLLFEDNKDTQILSLKTKLSINMTLYDLILNDLIAIQNASNVDSRIQLSILLLLISWCFECRESIHTIFNNPASIQYFELILNMASKGDNPYLSGLATYLIALFLEYGRNINYKNKYLSDIIQNDITITKFTNNLTSLRNTAEYVQMNKKITQIKKNLEKDMNRLNQLLLKGSNDYDSQSKISEILKKISLNYILNDYTHDTGCLNDLENSRMKIILFSQTFIDQFETIYTSIDKRIIQLIAQPIKNNPKINIPKAPIEQKDDSISKKWQIKFEELKTENDELKDENTKLKQENKLINNELDNKKKIIEKLMNDIKALQSTNYNQKYAELQESLHKSNQDRDDLLVYLVKIDHIYLQ